VSRPRQRSDCGPRQFVRVVAVEKHVRYTFRHTIETDVDSFWDKLFMDAEFNRALFRDFLEFTSYDVLEQRVESDGTVHRRIDCTPKVDLPAAVRKLFGDNVGYVEVGRYDPTQRKYLVEAVPKIGADRVKTTSEVWVEPRGDKRCERIVTVDNTVKAFGLGTLIESFIEQQTRELYQYSADFANQWIREKGL
jgi:hypothetical protein